MELVTKEILLEEFSKYCDKPSNDNLSTKYRDVELHNDEFIEYIKNRYFCDVWTIVWLSGSYKSIDKILDEIKTKIDFETQITNIIEYYEKVLRKNVGVDDKFNNGFDAYSYPYINEATLSAIRPNFKIPREETILLYRDTGFWSTNEQGLIITNEGIYCINDNNNKDAEFYIDWSNVDHVEYQELMLYFYDSSQQIANFPINYFVKDPDGASLSIGNELAFYFTNMARLVAPKENPLDNLIGEAYEVAEQGDYSRAIQMLQNEVNNVPDDTKLVLFYYIGDLYFKSGAFNECLKNCSAGLKFCEQGTPAYVHYVTLRSAALEKLNDFKQARIDCLDVFQYSTDEEWNGMKCKTYAENNFEAFDKHYSDSFLAMPYNERKVLLPVREYSDLHQNTVSVIRICNLPKLSLPIGHPIANQLYVGHPLIPEMYIPFENYQLELLEDKIREFCWLAQSLGASEISINTLNAITSDKSKKTSTNTDTHVDYKLVEANATVKKDSSSHLLDELSKSVNLHQKFEPTQIKDVTNDLVWYKNEPSWQRLFKQRMNGGLAEHEERIETKKNQMIEGRELTDLKGEIKVLFNKMNVSFSKEEENKFVQQENAVISIKVNFRPLSQLQEITDISKISSGSSSPLSNGEQEYLNEYKEMKESGELSDRDRRFLDKIKKSNGISDERANELEEMLSPSLTPEEQEYLNEFKEIIAEGDISARDQRYLDKLKSTNGISEERAREIENLA